MCQVQQEATSLVTRPYSVKLDILGEQEGGRGGGRHPTRSGNFSSRDALPGQPIRGRHEAGRAVIGWGGPMRMVGIYLTWLQPLGLTIEPLFLSLVISFRDSCCNTQTPRKLCLEPFLYRIKAKVTVEDNDIISFCHCCNTLTSLGFPPITILQFFSILAPNIPREAEKHQSGGNEEREKGGGRENHCPVNITPRCSYYSSTQSSQNINDQSHQIFSE